MQHTLSSAWRNPQFAGYDGFMSRIGECRRARMEPLEHKGQVVPDRFAIVDSDSGKFYAEASDRYQVVQNDQVLIPLAMALDQANIPFQGSVRESENGRMTTSMVIGEQILSMDSPYRFRLEVVNSYNCQHRVTGTLDLVRLVCANGMMGICGLSIGMSHKHMDGVDAEIGQWLDFITRQKEIIGNIGQVIELGRSKELTEGSFLSVLRGLGIGQRDAVYIVDNMRTLNHDIANQGLNAWTAYNSANAYYNHREKGNEQTNKDYLIALGAMLTDNLEPFIARGDDLLISEQDARLKRESARTTLKITARL